MSELRMFPYYFPTPKNWASCNGQLLAIAQNQALFSLLGTSYGGNGVTTFALPNLQGRVVLGASSQRPVGSAGGEANHTLLLTEMPQHLHGASGTTNTGSPAVSPSATRLGANIPTMYAQGGANVVLAPDTIGVAGSSQPHTNMQPYQVIQWCICLNGIFPSRN